jgi:hypothetical protein
LVKSGGVGFAGHGDADGDEGRHGDAGVFEGDDFLHGDFGRGVFFGVDETSDEHGLVFHQRG